MMPLPKGRVKEYVKKAPPFRRTRQQRLVYRRCHPHQARRPPTCARKRPGAAIAAVRASDEKSNSEPASPQQEDSASAKTSVVIITSMRNVNGDDDVRHPRYKFKSQPLPTLSIAKAVRAASARQNKAARVCEPPNQSNLLLIRQIHLPFGCFHILVSEDVGLGLGNRCDLGPPGFDTRNH